MAGMLNQIVKQLLDTNKQVAPKTSHPKNTTVKVKPVAKTSANTWVKNSTISDPMATVVTEEKSEEKLVDVSVDMQDETDKIQTTAIDTIEDELNVITDKIEETSVIAQDVSIAESDSAKIEIELPVVTAIDRSRKRERISTDVEKEDYLLTQIDEFREKAQQLQELLLSKESKVNELQTIVDEREIKAKELEHILNERQRKADGITAEVALQIDNLIEKVSAKMEEIGTSIGADLENGQKLSEEQMTQLRETLESLTEQLDTIKGELSEKVHSENVKCYRNVADLFKSMDDKMDAVEKENQTLLQKVASVHKCTIAVIVLSVLNTIGLIVSLLLNAGVFR